MINRIFPLLIVFAFLTGCASSSSLEDRAKNHEKSARYYESIGQPGAAHEEYKSAREDRDNALTFVPLLVELFNIVNDDKKGK